MIHEMLGLQRTTLIVAVQLRKRAGFLLHRGSSNVVTATATITPAKHQQPSKKEKGTTMVNRETVAESGDAITSRHKGALVAAVFEVLNEENRNSGKMTKSEPMTKTDESISNARTLQNLLATVDNCENLTRRHALRIIAILSEWSSIDKVKISEFENDSRFLRVCRLLGRTVTKNDSNENESKSINGFRADDLNTVLSVAGDDEAAKLIASISLSQMVKVMTTLAIRKRRSTPLLRSLAFNISSATEQLNLKQCADVFYAMAILNFKDSVLAAKLCSDVQIILERNNDKSAPIGSILTSLGILKYRDLDILEALTHWILYHIDICRPQDINSLLLTSAILNFRSNNIDEMNSKLVKNTFPLDFNRRNEWLNYVWSLSLIGLCEEHHLRSILSSDFLQKLETDECGLITTVKKKLLNLNAYAKLIVENYKGPLFEIDNKVFDVPMVHSKQKQILVNGMLDALKSLLPATNHIKICQDSKMGFIIDAICVFDDKRNPLPFDKEYPGSIKIALMIVDYNDVCHGTHRSLNGITSLMFNLLENSGYRVLPIMYNEINTSDKLLKRVQYIEGKLKSLISNKLAK